MIISLLDLFTTAKETGSNDAPNLTEERIYRFSHHFLIDQYPRVPVLSASTANEGVIGFVPDLRNEAQKKQQEAGRPVNAQGVNYYKNREEGCITIVADGVYAGYTFFRSRQAYPIFCANASCMILMKKDDEEIMKLYPGFDGLNLEWFNLRFHNALKNILRGEGVKHFTQTICASIEELPIPKLQEQERELEELKKLDEIRRKFEKITRHVAETLEKEVNGFAVDIQDDFDNVFHVDKGTGGFTEEGIYHAMPLEGHEEIPFFGGEKNHVFPQKHVREKAVNNKGKQVKYFDGECIILSMDGSAGCMTYKPVGERFTLNHHAAALTLKPAYKNRINLKWFKHEYQRMLVDSAVSKNSSRTLSKETLSAFVIRAPTLAEQETWVKEIEQLEKMSQRLQKIQDHIISLTEKEVSEQ